MTRPPDTAGLSGRRGHSNGNIPGGSRPRSLEPCPALPAGAWWRARSEGYSSASAPSRLERRCDAQTRTIKRWFIPKCSWLWPTLNTHTHPVPGFIIRPPLHIVIVVLHLDEPLSQDGRRVVYVVICRHPVEGWGMATTEKPRRERRTHKRDREKKKKHN